MSPSPEERVVNRKHRAAGIAEEMFDPLVKADLRKAGERTIPRLRRRIGGFGRRLTARKAGLNSVQAN
jgi:hypothetical protein